MLRRIFNIFAKMPDFSPGDPGKMNHFSPIFGCFSVVKHQASGITPENVGVVYGRIIKGENGTLLVDRLFENFTHFL